MLFLGHFVVVNWSEQLAVMQVMELLFCFHLQGLCVHVCVGGWVYVCVGRTGKQGLAKCGDEDDSQHEGNMAGEQSEGRCEARSCFSNVCRLQLPSLLLDFLDEVCQQQRHPACSGGGGFRDHRLSFWRA